MCGIVGYLGENSVKDILIDGLRELEYRGYDSAGIAVLNHDDIAVYKAVGKLVNLEQKAKSYVSSGYCAGIGHTRWATHGKPTELNAHPHLGKFSYVVHNGIIENYQELKTELQDKGVEFLSQTDTEVIVHLFEQELKTNSNSFEAFKATLSKLQGAYAVLLISTAQDKTIYYAKHGSPMILGKNGEHEKFFASSDTALIGYCKDAIYLEDGDYGYVDANSIKLFNANTDRELSFTQLPESKISAQKDGYRFFMEKEIYEQSDVISDTLLGRVKDSEIYFEELEENFFDEVNEIITCACGTSYHSALAASYLFERYSKIRCRVEIGSEFRYKEPLLNKNSLFITISQSGE
ncbi:MAG: glutamine--fructose-6-phosphate transaminase (isomerizing), partial [Campylobacterota bacterium]|nr:glutamine--fructose-6-phosphate transaminase (isomerizing) [Campylobacterota bacterium]